MNATAHDRRIRTIGVIVCIAASIVIGRLYYVQVVRSAEYRAMGDRQYVDRSQTPFDRGSIFFSPRTGAPIAAATLKSGYTISVQPNKVEHPEDVYNILSGILPFDSQALISKLAATTTTYFEVAKRVDEQTADRISALKLPGVGVARDVWRYYPAGSLAANVLGFVGYGSDGVTLTGQYGLEKSYNDVLSRSSSDASVNFFAEIFSNIGDSFLQNDSHEGDIVTTIDPTVQRQLEIQLQSVMDTWHSDLSGGIIMDPTTGEIYAMAMNPTFDPNDYAKVRDHALFADPLIDSIYEMGSIMKPLVMAAGLDTGIITPQTTYDDTGTVVVDGAKISNYDFKARGPNTPMQTILNDSLNVGMTFVAKTIGNDNVTKYLTAYGLGEETGIDLPGEVHGQIQNLESKRLLEHATASFGQGIAVTPIETIRALSALGNGGLLPNPHVVKEIDYSSGEVRKPSYDNMRRVIKPETSATITDMLVKVVDQALLGGTVKFAHYSMAAKTGTAQIPSPNGGYYTDRYLHSFFGYFPAYKPRFIIFLYNVYPKGALYASHTLTMPYINLAKFLINYYEVPPDR